MKAGCKVRGSTSPRSRDSEGRPILRQRGSRAGKPPSHQHHHRPRHHCRRRRSAAPRASRPRLARRRRLRDQAEARRNNQRWRKVMLHRSRDRHRRSHRRGPQRFPHFTVLVILITGRVRIVAVAGFRTSMSRIARRVIRSMALRHLTVRTVHAHRLRRTHTPETAAHALQLHHPHRHHDEKTGQESERGARHGVLISHPHRRANAFSAADDSRLRSSGWPSHSVFPATAPVRLRRECHITPTIPSLGSALSG